MYNVELSNGSPVDFKDSFKFEHAPLDVSSLSAYNLTLLAWW